MAEQPSAGPSGAERFRHLPPPVEPESLRASQDVDPPPPEEDDAYRELLWVVNRYG